MTVRKRTRTPDPQSILDKMYGDNYFSFMDAASAYWSVQMSEADIEKIAFATPRGHFEMLVMPFGLCNSQSTYQRIMDIALRRATNTESYVDDLCTHSRGFELHLRDLHTTLECLRDAKIQLRIDKCRFGNQEGEFLGQVISANGRRPAPALVDRIAKFPPPKSVKEMQRFLGLANYYRSLIPKFAEIAEPLNRLTRKCQPWDGDIRHRVALRGYDPY